MCRATLLVMDAAPAISPPEASLSREDDGLPPDACCCCACCACACCCCACCAPPGPAAEPRTARVLSLTFSSFCSTAFWACSSCSAVLRAGGREGEDSAASAAPRYGCACSSCEAVRGEADKVIHGGATTSASCLQCASVLRCAHWLAAPQHGRRAAAAPGQLAKQHPPGLQAALTSCSDRVSSSWAAVVACSWTSASFLACLGGRGAARQRP